ncbi:MAG: hypothetical protein N4A46_01870 [Schleiferiaceae bacterium]|jgi:hypothetical protein|nr:hypothetical protein [Schleiferiaceae bacterium]
MNKFIAILFTVFALQACNTQKPVSGDVEDVPTENEDKPVEKREAMSLIIGEGGGFTGRYTFYRLSENGQVDLYNEQEEIYTEVGKLKSSFASRVFEEAEQLKLGDMEYYKPGNMNYRITITDEGQSNTINWSDNQSPGQEVLLFYKKVMNEISTLK